MDVDFRASLGLFATRVRGTAEIEAGKVVLRVDLPKQIRVFLSEDEVHKALAVRLADVLSTTFVPEFLPHAHN